MSDPTDIIASVVVDLVRQKLTKGGRGSMLRVRGFKRDEIARIATGLAGFRFDGDPRPLTVVVGSHEPWEGLDQTMVLPAGSSATSLRNQTNDGSLSGYVLLEDKSYTDSQSLGRVTAIDDRSLLTGPESAEVRAQIVAACWEASGAMPELRPSSLHTCCEEVFAALAQRAGDVALRRWVEFVLDACVPLALDRATDAGEVGEAVGLALPVLSALPDRRLFTLRETERRRRLATNLECADGLDHRGRPVHPDDVAARLPDITFRDAGEQAFPQQEQVRLRERVRQLLFATTRLRRDVELDVWLQLFPDGAPARGLGERIRDHLAQAAVELVDDFDRLGVADGLDRGEMTAAGRLVDDGESIMVRLPRPLVRAVDRLAEPRGTSVEDPFRFLLREIHAVLQDSSASSPATIELELRRIESRSADDLRTIRLFAFLYGPTLRRLAGAGGGARVRLLVDPELTATHGNVLERLSAEVSDPETAWGSMLLELRFRNSNSPLRRVEWRPLEQLGLVAIAALVASPLHQFWRSGQDSFESWCRRLLEVVAAPRDNDGSDPFVLLDGGLAVSEEHPLLQRWRQLRLECFGRLQVSGFTTEALFEYVDAWSTEILRPAYDGLVPTGAPLPALHDLLSLDTFRDVRGNVTMLATHPLRLRWIAIHFQKSAELLQELLDGGLELNPVNDGFYFDALAQLSPHEQPPVLTSDEKIYVSVREENWHEHYATLRRANAGDDAWLSDLDDSSIDEMANVVGEYVSAHPHKADGVSVLLLVRQGGARLLQRLARKAFRGNHAPRRARLHIVTPIEEAPAIERALADFDDPEQRSESDTPMLDVVVHAWPDGDGAMPSLTDFDEVVDLALVPNLFGSHTRSQEATRPKLDDAPGAFDPWLDPPTHIDMGASDSAGENVSRVLLPQRADQMLAQWSTLTVRGYRHNQVGGDVDFMTLQVRFDRSRALFNDLHRVAQWVVALDAFIGRDQLEALPQKPDVITVRPDLGKGGAYTLIVSSSSGGPFIIDRLVNRLVSDVPALPRERVRVVAERLYESSRFLAPGILLRALGLGWAVQELVGLSIARRLTDRRQAVAPAEGFVAWISLDEHADWFGPGRRSRADLARIAFLRDAEGHMHLTTTVVEAKFREQSAASADVADDQVANTVDLLQHALGSGEGGRRGVDIDFWRREILAAIEQLPRGGSASTRAITAWDAQARQVRSIPALVREDWLKGDYVFDPVVGVVCTISPSEAVHDPIQRTPKEHVWYRVGGSELSSIVASIGGTDLPEQAGKPRVGDVSPDVGQRSSLDLPEPQPLLMDIESTHVELPAGIVAVAERPRGHTTDYLEVRYRRVLDVFSEFRVAVTRPQVDPYREGPGFYVFRVQPAVGVRPETVRGHGEEIKLKLGLAADAIPRSYVDRGCVVFEIPKPEDDRYFVAASAMWSRTIFGDNRLNTPIGEDIKGDVVEIDFSSDVSPHLLIAGQTGSGKSVALETILLGLVRHRSPERLKLALVDPKTTELARFENEPHMLRPIGYEPEDAAELLDLGVDEMQRRRDLFRAVRARSLPEYNERVASEPERLLPWWVLVLDEYADLTADRADKRRIEESLQRLAAKARASGIHIIIATQRPSADVISTVVRSNLPAQLALRVRSGIESNIVMAETGAEALAGKGDAFFRTAQRLVRVQCAYAG